MYELYSVVGSADPSGGGNDPKTEICLFCMQSEIYFAEV